jgi:hypothetical protein
VVRVGARVAVVSPDSDEIMIASRRRARLRGRAPRRGRPNPRTLAAIGDEWLAVANQDDAP